MLAQTFLTSAFSTAATQIRVDALTVVGYAIAILAVRLGLEYCMRTFENLVQEYSPLGEYESSEHVVDGLKIWSGLWEYDTSDEAIEEHMSELDAELDLELINEERAESGLPPIEQDDIEDYIEDIAEGYQLRDYVSKRKRDEKKPGQKLYVEIEDDIENEDFGD